MSALPVSRRGLMATGLALAGFPRFAHAAVPTDRRLVIVLLRGAMDGLSAVPAHGDPDYQRARNGIGTPPPGSGGDAALDLNGFFGLSPALRGLHARYGKGELVVFHAIASPYRDRSHFDGQNLLENGSAAPFGLADGWANRALMGLPQVLRTGRKDLGIAIAPSMPLMMRGPSPVTSWSPSVLPEPNADLVARIRAMYEAGDPPLARALVAAADANGAAGGTGRGDDAFAGLMAATARFLKAPDGPCLAMVESTGWDTHANQLGAFGVLSRNLAALDRGIDALADGLGDRWGDTAVLVMTEFGRTVAMNGTRGTDHGTAGAAFLVGGAVKGGRVLADWPGLRPADLHAGRDLRPTADLRSVMKAALVEHLGVDAGHSARIVFPDSAAAPLIPGLFRA
jgi:uncharacterized protein (DUF1501 family)